MARNSVLTDNEEDFDFDPDAIDVSEDEEEELEDDEYEDDDEGETEEPAQPSSQDNWEQRFKGLQASLQRSQEERAMAMQEALMAKAHAVRTELAASGLEPPEQERQFKMWMITQANEYQARQNASDREALEYVSRSAYLDNLVKHYGIDTNSSAFQKLSRIKDPEDMRLFAEEVASQKTTAKKQTKKAVRKAKGSDKFDSGGGRVGTPPKKKAKDLDDAASIMSKFKIDF